MAKFSFEIKKSSKFSYNFRTFLHPSTLTLIATNLYAVNTALRNGWILSDFMILYCIQSVIIGIFQFLKILDLKKFTTDGLSMNGQPVKKTKQAKKMVAFFFAAHYGFFHFIYFIFLFAKFININTIASDLLWLSAVFLFNHGFSFFSNRHHDQNLQRNLGSMMFIPYLRILPMHFSILFGSTSKSTHTLRLFIFLKILADVLGHIIEHNLETRKRSRAK